LSTTFLFYLGGAFYLSKNVYNLTYLVLEYFTDFICDIGFKNPLEVDKILDILEKCPNTADTIDTVCTDNPTVEPQDEGNWFYRNRKLLMKITAFTLAVVAGALAFVYFGGAASPFKKDDGYVSEDYPGYPGPLDFKRVLRRLERSKKIKKKYKEGIIEYWLWREKTVMARYAIPEDWHEIWNFLLPVYDEDIRPWKKRRLKK